MKASELDGFRKTLLDEKERLSSALEYLQTENPGAEVEDVPELGNLEAHLAEVSSLTLDREIDYSLEEGTRQSLAAVDEALERIANGSFGLCTSCGAEMSERLQARPWASLCIDCKRREERS